MLLRGKRIFIVEDNPANAGIMMTTLQMQGATTFFERWGIHVVPRLKQIAPIDLILMDLMLAHDVSGYDVFAEIQSYPELAHIPAVVVSASDATIELNKARQSGFAGYISKPIQYTTFPGQIAAILNGQAIWAEEL